MKQDIDIKTFQGKIPAYSFLMVYEKGQSTKDGIVLEGFGEEGLFDHNFKNPQYCFLKFSNETIKKIESANR
jgi:hypothetical protein